MARRQAKKLGKLSIDEMRNLINKKAGMQVGFDLSKENPTDVCRGRERGKAGRGHRG